MPGRVHFSEMYGCREVVTEPKWFPSFSPDDFPACHEAAQKALSLAQAAAAADTTGSKVTCTELHLSMRYVKLALLKVHANSHGHHVDRHASRDVEEEKPA